MTDDTSTPNPVELATELTMAWLGNPNTRASSEDVPAFLSRMHEAVIALSNAADPTSEPTTTEYAPATTVRRSLASNDHIISMIDGKPYKTLRRHLSTHGLTPVQYRERYKLKADYPIVARNYSETRRAMALKIGLGQKGRSTRATATKAEAPTPASRRGRKPKTPTPE